jgi:hypothetical protein
MPQRFEGRWVVPYIVSQCLGAVLASLERAWMRCGTLMATLGPAPCSATSNKLRSTPRFQNGPMISEPFMVLSACHVSRVMELLMNCTLPSQNSALTPPG